MSSPSFIPGPIRPPRAALVPDGLQEGVVVRVDRGAATVESGGELVRASWGGTLLAAVGRDLERWPCAGDRVAWRRWPDGPATVEAVLPRRTLLRRSDACRGSRLQPLAANIDRVAVVEALAPAPHPARVRRLLTLARASRAEPLLVLTKADLVPDAERPAAELSSCLGGAPGSVPDAGCPVLVVSAATGAGLDRLAAALAGRTTALLGASGVGKSSLLHALADAGGPLGSFRGLCADGRGRPGTVGRELHRVAGGAVIDGPGLRSVSLGDAEQLDRTFQDLVDLAAGCRSADCGHVDDAGCELQAGIERGDLDPRRLEVWLELQAGAGQASGW